MDGDYAYVADRIALQVIDISDIENPVLVGSIITPGSPRDVFVSGDLAYVADEEGLSIIGISDPANPVYLGGTETPDLAVQVHVSGDHAYVADWTAGLQVIDVSDPASPAWGVHISGNHAFAGAGPLEIVRLNDHVPPSLRGTLTGNLWGVDV